MEVRTRSAPEGRSKGPAFSTTGPPLPRRLEAAEGYAEVFEVVKESVRRVLGKERTGLGLALAELPPGLGAYWPVTGNVIVLNEALVRSMRLIARNRGEFNSFLYVILSHEYLHTLGYLSEGSVRPVTAYVARASFGPDHPATRMAQGDLWQMYPELRWARPRTAAGLRLVRDFDAESVRAYIR
jgi:hypothetical protein